MHSPYSLAGRKREAFLVHDTNVPMDFRGQKVWVKDEMKGVVLSGLFDRSWVRTLQVEQEWGTQFLGGTIRPLQQRGSSHPLASRQIARRIIDALIIKQSLAGC